MPTDSCCNLPMNSSACAIKTEALTKHYRLYGRPSDRLCEMLLRRPRHRLHKALENISFDVRRGEVLGIIGRNGAGKSTLLQLICGTLRPSSGVIAVTGRIAALLELGAGFNPEFSGRENVYLNGAILGLSPSEISARFADIAAFADIGDFIEQPVKTYSSGMFVRLAFAVAVNVEPDILVIDEALSVGDGAFARKSFERIMALKDAGKTILFCSHSLYQVEALCSRALWLERGEARAFGPVQEVVKAYNTFLESVSETEAANSLARIGQGNAAEGGGGGAMPRLTRIRVAVDGSTAPPLVVESGISDLEISLAFTGGGHLPEPTLAVVIRSEDGRVLTSAGSIQQRVSIPRDAAGNGEVTIVFDRLPLLKGDFLIDAYLLCERSVLEYDHVFDAARFQVKQEGAEQGIICMPHSWRVSEAP